MRDVCVFTSSRADFGLLRPVMGLIRESTDLRLRLLASGSHLSPEFGLTKTEVCEAGFTIDEEVEVVVSADTPTAICSSMGLALIGFGSALVRLEPSVLLVLGDRYETLCASTAAQVCLVPVAHIHGGETSQGAMDEAFRHAITKMSHLHFASCELHRRRIIQMGEQPAHVFNVGALGVENVRRTALMSRQEVASAIGLPENRPFLLVTFHPVTLERATAEVQFSALLEALEAFTDHAVLLTRSNADVDGRVINETLEGYRRTRPTRAVVAASLGMRTYLSAMSHADAVVGNSSSGLLEAPALRVPTVNIGDRQKGRLGAASVIDCDPKPGAIVEAIRTALSEEFRGSLAGMTHPCEQPDTAARIVQQLCEAPLDGILKKPFYDRPEVVGADGSGTTA